MDKIIEMISKQDELIKLYGEEIYFNSLNNLIAEHKLNTSMKAEDYFKAGGDV